MAQNIESIINAGQEKGFRVERGKDYEAGPINVVRKINVHPAIREIKCGFVKIEAEESGNHDTEENQLSLWKIEEAAFRGIRSGLVYILAENEEMAKSISGKIEWLASHGSILRLDAISLGLSRLYQKEPSIVISSQERVPEDEKIRKQDMHEREAKLYK